MFQCKQELKKKKKLYLLEIRQQISVQMLLTHGIYKGQFIAFYLSVAITVKDGLAISKNNKAQFL